MECNRFLEEKLAGTESPEFRHHRAGCEGCRRDLEECDEVRRLYREASVERYSGAVPRVRRFRPGSWLPAAAAAAVLVGVLCFLLFGGPGELPERGLGEGEPVVAFVRVHLEPWNPAEARLNEEMNDLWGRIETLERRGR